jgi:hypothetical protein
VEASFVPLDLGLHILLKNIPIITSEEEIIKSGDVFKDITF